MSKHIGDQGHFLVSFDCSLDLFGSGCFVTYFPDFIHPGVWLTLMALIGSLLSISLTRLMQVFYSLVREERCNPFAL